MATTKEDTHKAREHGAEVDRAYNAHVRAIKERGLNTRKHLSKHQRKVMARAVRLADGTEALGSRDRAVAGQHLMRGYRERKVVEGSNCSSVLWRFKHTGAVPEFDPVLVERLRKVGTPLALRLVRQLLVRAGVEENPGPSCRYIGTVPPTKMVKLAAGSFGLVCQGCSCKVVKGQPHPDDAEPFRPKGKGPAEGEDEPSPEAGPEPVPSTSRLSVVSVEMLASPTSVDSTSTLSTQRADFHDKTSKAKGKKVQVPAPPPVGVEATSALSRMLRLGASKLQLKRAGQKSGRVLRELGAPVAGCPVKPDCLRGLAVDSLALRNLFKQYAAREGCEIAYGYGYATTTTRVPYVGDQRLLTDRGVRIVDLAHEVVLAQACLMFMPRYWQLIALVFMMLGAGWLPFPLMLGLWFIGVIVLGLVAFYAWPRLVRIPYVPHMVSCVVADYNPDVSPEVVVTNTRAKLRRLAGMPIRDFEAVQLIDGSELAIRAVMATRGFQGAGVVYDGQPRPTLLPQSERCMQWVRALRRFRYNALPVIWQIIRARACAFLQYAALAPKCIKDYLLVPFLGWARSVLTPLTRRLWRRDFDRGWLATYPASLMRRFVYYVALSGASAVETFLSWSLTTLRHGCPRRCTRRRVRLSFVLLMICCVAVVQIAMYHLI